MNRVTIYDGCIEFVPHHYSSSCSLVSTIQLRPPAKYDMNRMTIGVEISRFIPKLLRTAS